ncbi:5-oxoprolinase subunit PxpB [Flavihumibacter rivuli]|uniref:5-oxoprolinase subunit PxpB n=1 Tax=Flavihumibacter rivuli TaxID=2838156 RepID=UPI001BDEAF4F|nr:5-oxoprolinase subunit PxpB [Flavihumibacter rivuli]ULQ55600.1 5-oxoprolinase subunit PxpB [Flavihumibacter rivuli]
MNLLDPEDHLHQLPAIRIYPVAEHAITISIGEGYNRERHRLLLYLAAQLGSAALPGLLDLSIAYNSLTVFFDPIRLLKEPHTTPVQKMTRMLQGIWDNLEAGQFQPEGRHHIIPVCYDGGYGPDLEPIAKTHSMDSESLIKIFESETYYVYMVGFSPGFPYMGTVPDQIASPRKASPALRVAPGSVGIAGNQTGIYPQATPGGWQIIGRTPLKIFDADARDCCLFKPGDTVSFSRIDSATFKYLNQYEDA